jgi:hypothetical protein
VLVNVPSFRQFFFPQYYLSEDNLKKQRTLNMITYNTIIIRLM